MAAPVCGHFTYAENSELWCSVARHGDAPIPANPNTREEPMRSEDAFRLWTMGYRDLAGNAAGGQAGSEHRELAKIVLDARAAEENHQLAEQQRAAVCQMQAALRVQSSIARSTRWLAIATLALAVATALIAFFTWQLGAAGQEAQAQDSQAPGLPSPITDSGTTKAKPR